MSNIPTPTAISPTPQQISGSLKSVLMAAQKLISSDSKHLPDLRTSFLQFYHNPTFQLILGLPTQNQHAPSPPDNQLRAELADLKSSISALSKTVASLQPKAKGAQVPLTPAQTPPPKGNPSTQGKGPTHPPLSTYASKAATKARPSLVLDLGATTPDQQLDDELTGLLNGRLQDSGFEDIKFSAARYTKKGNLVLTAHHTSTQSQLDTAAHEITSLVKQLHFEANCNRLLGRD
ncbi:hypothetical protein F5888DRAFT_1806112 [Russula emetica]|nr:hypothetical protein F5888DRAFT_1806112 [Russula emetica]